MEEYIDENGNLYTVDEINKTAKEYNTNFQDIIKKNKLSLKSKKQEKVKAVKAEEPGKPKSVVKEDVPATVKSTASKSVKPSSASRTNLWGEDKSQPEFVTNLQEVTKQKQVPVSKPGYKYDSRGYLVPKTTKESSLWDDTVDFAKNLFADKTPDTDGKLAYYDQTPIKEQQKSFKLDSKDALEATGKFEFLKDYSAEDRALFVSKLVPKTSYTEKKYNQITNQYDIAPKQEAMDYVMQDIDPSKFKTKAQLDNAISLNVKKLASEDSSFEFEQKYAKAKAAPLINSKIAEIKKKYKLDTAESVNKATKELQDYAAKTTTDFLVNSSGFQHLNQTFASIEDQAKNTLTREYERGKEGELNFFDKQKRIGTALEEQGGITGVAGTVIKQVGRFAEGAEKTAINIGLSGMQTNISAKHGEVNALNDFYNKYKDKPDNEKFNLPETWNDTMAGAEGIGQTESLFGTDVPKTFGEAKKRIKEGVNKINTEIEAKVNKIADTKEYLGLFNQADLKNGIQLDDIFTLVGEQVPNLAITAAGSVTGNPLLIGLGTASMFTQTYGSQYYDTIEAGLKEDIGRAPTKKEIAEAIGKGEYANRAEAAAWSALSAGLEYASELNILKNTGKALGLGNNAKTVLGSLFRGEVKNFGKSVIQKGTNMSKSAFGEYLTESVQQGFDQASKGTQLQNDATRYINQAEINEAGKAGGIVGFVFPFAGTIYTQTGVELRAAATKVATTFDLSNKNMANLTQVDNFFKAAIKNIDERFKVGDITQDQKQMELETLGTIRSSGAKIPSDFSAVAKEKSLNLILEKANIEKSIEGKDKDLVAPELERIKAIQGQLIRTSREQYYSNRLNKELETLETLTRNAEEENYGENAIGEGRQYHVIENASDMQSQIEKWYIDNGLESNLYEKDKDDNVLLDANGERKKINFAGDVAAELPNGQIIINKAVAKNVDEGASAGRHELLHKILKSQFNDPANGQDLLKKFKSTLSSKENKVVEQRLTDRGYSEEYLKDSPDEYLTQFFEALEMGEITFSDGTFNSMWKRVLRPIYKALGFEKLDFESGNDIYNFIKDYHKTSKKGIVTKRQKELLAAGKGITGKYKTSKPVEERIEDLYDAWNAQEIGDKQFEEQLAILEDEEANGPSVQIEPIKKESIRKEPLEKEPKSKGNLQNLLDIKYEGNQKRLASEGLRNTPSGSVTNDFSKSIIGKELGGTVETITRRLYDPIAADAKRNVTRDEYKDALIQSAALLINNEFDPSKQTLDKFISSRLNLRANALAYELGIEGATKGGIKKDAAEEKGLMADETADQGFTETVKEKPKYKNALEAKVFPSEVLETAVKKIITIARTLKTRIDAPITLNRTVTPLIAEIRDEVGKQLDIDIKTMLGGKKDGVLKKELLRTKRYILENMTTTWLMGKDGQGGIPMAVQKQVDGKWINFPDWVGQKIDREKTTTDQAGRTSGAELVRRLPNVANNISDEVFLAQIIGPDGNPIRGRKESLSKAMAEEGAFDIINNDLQNEGPIHDAVRTNQERLGAADLGNMATEIAKQSERGNIKASKTIINGIKLSEDKLGEDLFNAVDLESEIKIINDWIASDGRSIRTLAYVIFGKNDPLTTNLGLFQEKILPIIEVNSKFGGFLTKDSYTVKIGPRGYSIYLGEDKVPLWKDTEVIKKNWQREIETINSEAIEATNRLIGIADSFRKRKKTEEDLRSYFAVLKYDQRGLARKVSKAGLGVLGMKASQKPYLEHNAPNYDIMEKVIDYFNKKITEKQLRKFIENSKVNLVPKELNDFLPAYKEGENRMHDPRVVLYMQGLIDKGYKILNLEAEYGSKTKFNALVRLAKSNVISNENIQNINNEKAVGASLKSSKPSKGISVFDFDDTVGLTSGSVLYTMPDGAKGKLNAEEFAKEGGNMLDAGGVFDFSEFSKVVDGKPGPMVEKMKKMIGKFGPENFFILTARPANAAGPIHEFLSSIGIDIPLENITGLGSSLAQSKADWMTAKAAEGYNDFYFADDAIQNVEAVKKALEVPGITSKVQQARLKFSLTSKQDLKWRQSDEDLSATFKIGNINYRIAMIETAYMEYDNKTQAILDDLVEENNLDEDNTTMAWDGEAYNLEFWDKKQGNGITGSGNAAEVFGVVINGVTDRIKKKNIEALIFTAKETSRIKLYNAMAMVVANKLGWNVYSKEGVYILAKKPLAEITSSFENQPNQVKDVLNVVDIKSAINQSKVKFSKTISPEFNKIIEENKGMEHYKVFSDIVARRRGKSKNKFDFYVPPSAADFELLLYNFMGKGERGEEHQKFFNEALLKPYANGNDLMDAARQSIKKDYKALLDSFPDIRKKMETLTPDGDYTYDQAIRVAMWNEEGVEIPGISERDSKKLTELVNNDPELAAFKQGLIVTGRQGKGWINPTEYWDANTIIADLHGLTEGEGRKKFLAEFIDNAEQMFGTWSQGKLVGPNINKVEAVYGSNVREAIEDVLYRMTTGKNRSQGKDKETSAWSNWVNGSTGAIMFLNTRSAALQLIGAVNFLNLRDNNPVAAGKAFLNQPQYWKDFSRIWNSDKMKERRGGLKEDVAAAEIANAAAGSKNKPAAVIAYLLKIGYTPTQLADSFAIASGGAPFYRNRIKSYLKEGLTEQEAKDAAWNDFTKVSDETQQSGDPRDISKQQASGAGRLLLTFQNTAMQQSRIVKKSYLDLKAGRGNAKTHVSKIIYYLAIQNTLFAVLQQGLFAVAFDDEDEEKDKDKEKAKKKTINERLIDVADGVLDTILRGTGFAGGVVSVLKNMTKKYLDEKDKNFKADYAKVVLEGANISPPIGSKLRKLYTGLQQTKFEKDLIAERGWGVMQDGRVHLGPMYSVTGKLIEATTNVPIDRLVNKIENVSQAMNSENQAWQRVAVGVGFTPYSLGIEESKGDLEIRAKAKEIRKEEGKIKSAETRQRTKDSIRALPIRERVRIKREAALKRREEKIKKRNRKMG